MVNYLREPLGRIFRNFFPAPIVRNTYSQAGEDAILAFLFSSMNKSPTYLDLGTNSPDWGNNTYIFYTWGSRGVLVEADRSLISKIEKVRPDDKVLNVGVSIYNQKSADFYIFSETSLNTFNKAEAEMREKIGKAKITKVVQVQLMSINDIISENFESYPDLMSIDIEGLDFEVLQFLDFEKFPIPVICAETCTYSENHIKHKDKRIEHLLLEKGYFIYGDTYVNTIFVNKIWFNR